ncbi:selenium cofactor biosynthesis protein YqeC [uncultured Intestinimonas sp.]|uniref:selenium cofactor biosynthesis protein YqeC n=1 Tax=uncultured Intestinimonas sp. TaxID=1689265 RepID=UPI0025ED6288|nr:selenium cofactor biosynthesis protein YqeC [uncultured Intestinimonas sp.]
MELLEALALPAEGWTCLVGGGGKSSLMLRLMGERAGRGLPALAATTTHIGVEQGRAAGPLVGTLEKLEAARRAGLTACAAGTEPETGKLTAPPPEVLDRGLSLFGFGVVEADGSKRLPMKAPADHEPCLIPGCAAVVAVAGLSALGRPLGETCHRSHLACALLGVGPETAVTPALLARLLTHEAGQFKGVGDPKKFRVLLNQADGPEELALARETARDIQIWLPGTRVVAAALREKECVKEVFVC